MSASRTSNKQILDAIEAMPAAIAAAIAATQVAAPAAPAVITTPEVASQPESIQLDKAYVDHMASTKCLDFANKHGSDVVLYARKNAKGENKLAYCLAEKFPTLRDKGLLGAVQVVSPS